MLCIDTSVTNIESNPIVNRIMPVSGPIAGNSTLTVTGVNMNVYPVLGAYFNDSELPTLYGYADLRFR